MKIIFQEYFPNRPRIYIYTSGCILESGLTSVHTVERHSSSRPAWRITWKQITTINNSDIIIRIICIIIRKKHLSISAGFWSLENKWFLVSAQILAKQVIVRYPKCSIFAKMILKRWEIEQNDGDNPSSPRVTRAKHDQSDFCCHGQLPAKFWCPDTMKKKYEWIFFKSI